MQTILFSVLRHPKYVPTFTFPALLSDPLNYFCCLNLKVSKRIHCPYWDCMFLCPTDDIFKPALTHTHSYFVFTFRQSNELFNFVVKSLHSVCPCALWNAQVFRSSPFAPRICLAERREKDRPAGPICPFM